MHRAYPVTVSRDGTSQLPSHKGGLGGVRNSIITESFRLEKTFKIIKPNC